MLKTKTISYESTLDLKKKFLEVIKNGEFDTEFIARIREELLVIENEKNNEDKEDKEKKILQASIDGDEEKVKNLLNESIDLNKTQNLGGNTPLHLAVANSHYEIVKLLLKHGANPEQKGSDDNTPLHFAAGINNLEMLKLVAEWGIENENNKETRLKTRINAKNEFGWSVLHATASGITNVREYYKANWEVIKWLLEKGADYLATTKNDKTIEDIFEQEDWSYIPRYQEILDNYLQKCQQELT